MELNKLDQRKFSYSRRVFKPFATATEKGSRIPFWMAVGDG